MWERFDCAQCGNVGAARSTGLLAAARGGGVWWVKRTADTPWRFRNKSALWKYLGIGLARRGSGGPVRLVVPVHGNKLLRSAVMSAARTAIRMRNNEFADLYERWIAYGLTPRVACRNVARRQSAVLWGLWKNGGAYRPEWIGRSLQTAAVP